jgi:predicted Fe-Mo cluster-binding NifX family protein
MLPELSTIKIGQPAHRALHGAGIITLEQLAGFKESELLALHGFGPKALGILKAVLIEHGLVFKEESKR